MCVASQDLTYFIDGRVNMDEWVNGWIDRSMFYVPYERKTTFTDDYHVC